MRGSKTALRDMSYVCCHTLVTRRRKRRFLHRVTTCGRRSITRSTRYGVIPPFLFQGICHATHFRAFIASRDNSVCHATHFRAFSASRDRSQRPNMPIRHMPMSPFIGEPTARQAHATWPMHLQQQTAYGRLNPTFAQLPLRSGALAKEPAGLFLTQALAGLTAGKAGKQPTGLFS